MHQQVSGLQPGAMGLLQFTAVSEAMLAFTSLHDLRLLRNEIFARRGRIFRTPWIADYFSNEPWYRPRPDFSESELTAVERANIATIVAVESGRREQLRTTELLERDLVGLYPHDARMLRNEIYARHGRVFKDKALQAYFSSLPWYRPDTNFDEGMLSDIELRNIAVIGEYERQAAAGERFIPPG